MSEVGGKRKAGKKLSKFQKKAKYGGGIHKQQNPHRGPALKEDLHGVLLTTDSGKDGPAITDAYRLFNEVPSMEVSRCVCARGSPVCVHMLGRTRKRRKDPRRRFGCED